MADPIKLLRQYNVSGLEIIERDNQIILGESSWPKDFTTKMVASNKTTNTKDYYTLECLLYFLKNFHKSHPQYVQEAVEANIQAVRRPDRKNIMSYMVGHVDTCPCIEDSAPSDISTQLKRTHEHSGDESVAKKPRNEEPHKKKNKRKRKKKQRHDKVN